MSRLSLTGWRLRRRVAIAVLAQLIAVALALVGVSVLPLFFVAALPWLLVCGRRFGAAISASIVVLGSAWLLLVVLVTVAAVHVPMLVTIIIVWLIIGLAGSLALGDSRVSTRLSPAASAVWLPALLGPLIWLGVEIVSLTLRGAAHYSWVMSGDSANNVLFARAVIARGGVAIGGQENPVPLPSALLALSMMGGRSGVEPAHLLQHDIAAFVIIWTLLIAATCYFAGIAASALVDRNRPRIVALVGAGVSLLPLTWFVSGYPIEFGFFNMHIALPIVFLCCIATICARRSPITVLVLLLLACTLLLAVWSPLVLIPATLGLFVGVSHWRVVLRVRDLPLGILIASLAQLLGYVSVVVLPGLFAQGSALSAGGAAYPFAKKFMVVVFLIGGLTFLLAHIVGPRTSAWTLFSVFMGGGVGLAALLFISRNAVPSPWTYYPSKLVWVVMVVGLVMILGALAAVVSRGLHNFAVVALALVSIACLGSLVVVVAPKSVPTYVPANVLQHVMSVNEAEATAERIFELSNPKQPSILWNSGENDEGSVNFWLMQMHAGLYAKNTPLRVLAYGYNSKDIKALCTILHFMGNKLTVRTAEAGLRNQLQGACPSSALSVKIRYVS